MSEDNEIDKNSLERRKSARSTDIARKIVEQITAREMKKPDNKKDADPDSEGSKADTTDK